MFILIVSAILLGILAALYFAGYGMCHIPCPFDRVAFYWTILSIDVISIVLAYLFLPSTPLIFLFILLLTKCIMWCIMDPEKMIHTIVELE
jgi:hypothetical protein